MRKFLKILGINFLILLLCLIVSEIVIYSIAKEQYYSDTLSWWPKDDLANMPPLKYNPKLMSARDAIDYSVHNSLRKQEGENSAKKAIVLFGCSFTYGDGLTQNQTFGHKLYEQTNRPVYNRRISGSGVQHMYYQLNDSSFYSEIKKEPEYIIYIFSPYLHTHRLYAYIFSLYEDKLYLRYYPDKVDKNGNLIEKKPFVPEVLSGLYLVKYYEYLKTIQDMKNSSDNFYLLLFKKSMEKVKKHYPNAKFVVFCFDMYKNESEEYTSLIENLKSEGFIIVKTNELTDIDYSDTKYHISETDVHPNEYFWDLITPKFVERLKLNK